MSQASSSAAFHKEDRVVERPIWREVFVGLEWAALRVAPVFYGLGVPHGRKEAVIVVPGFLGTDLYLQEMYSWLRRIGYRSYMSKIGWNAECLDMLVGRLSVTIKRAVEETGGPVHLVGHSLGGVLARSAAARHPERVASVTALGSPFRGISSHPLVLSTARRVRSRIQNRNGEPDCYTGFCGCQAVGHIQAGLPSSVRQTAIYTKSDGIVDWRVCVTDNQADNFEVKGTHVGLVFNHTVYELIAKRLAAKP